MKITIIGHGSHAAAVCDSIRQLGEYQIEGLLSENLPIGEKSCGYRIIGNPHSKEWTHLMTFPAIGDNSLREKFSQLEFQFINVIHPTAQLGTIKCKGTYFAANSFVGNGARVGNFCILNTSSVLEHDSSIGDYSHLAPGVVTGGRVKIGDRTFIGLGASVRDGISIGSNCIIGMSSCVLEDIPDNTVWFGNPARLQREIK